jgi:hypothetical protein
MIAQGLKPVADPEIIAGNTPDSHDAAALSRDCVIRPVALRSLTILAISASSWKAVFERRQRTAGKQVRFTVGSAGHLAQKLLKSGHRARKDQAITSSVRLLKI